MGGQTDIKGKNYKFCVSVRVCLTVLGQDPYLTQLQSQGEPSVVCRKGLCLWLWLDYGYVKGHGQYFQCIKNDSVMSSKDSLRCALIAF